MTGPTNGDNDLNIAVSSFADGFRFSRPPESSCTQKHRHICISVVRPRLSKTLCHEPRTAGRQNGSRRQRSVDTAKHAVPCPPSVKIRVPIGRSDDLRRRRDPFAGHGHHVGPGPRDTDNRLFGVGQDDVVELYSHRTTRQENRRHTERIRRG